MKYIFKFFIATVVCAGFLAAQSPEPKPEPKPEAPAPAQSQPSSPPAATKPAAPADNAPKKKSIVEVTKNCQEYKGLFQVFADRETGALYLFIKKDQIRREFIYFSHVVDGVVQAGRNRGQFDQSEVFTISKVYGKLEFVLKNTAYYFDPDHPLARAANANISNAIVAAEPIIASNDEGYLVSAGSLFLKESFMQVKPSSSGPENKAVLGKLSESKTKFTRWGSYPRNSFFVVEYVYENPAPPHQESEAQGLQDMADPRYVSIRVQHTLVALPENDYQPRADDPRVGYFMTHLTDQISTEATPYRDFIHRWNLTKKEPEAALSEPVEPIVWWIENTTPLEFRETIKSAALLWNKSFEKIGFKNALVVNVQPDDAKWNADDLEHNVLRWTSSPRAPFGGYGPSFSNPRTGQILGADIMFEFSFVKNRVMAHRLWDELGMAGLSKSNHDATFDQHACMAATMTQQGLLFGSNMLRLRKADQVDFDTMLKESMAQLILHELGHTLGLNHNFRASHLHSPAELRDRVLTERTGLSASVMDYMPLNLGPDKSHQGQYYMNTPGVYDDWAIDYGYSQALPDAAAETKRLGAIASRSNEPQLGFANDADDMRMPGKGIDPRAQVFDMSSDPVTYGTERCEIVQQAIGKLMADRPKEGRSWQELLQSYISLTAEKSNALTAVSRYIGGVYVERAFVGQVKENTPDPFKPVEAEKQKAAMDTLAKFAFGPDSWQVPEDLLRHLQQQRRGFDFRENGEDPKLHERVLKFQRALLDHLLHPNTQNRIIDSALYGNGYPLHQMMRDLTQMIMSGEPANAPVSTVRQNLQVDYVDRLIGILKGKTHFAAARSVALYEVQRIQKNMEAESPDVIDSNRPHHAQILFVIKQGLEDKKA